ncbi:hypothetical protein K437DRAFT_253511, partial [Tilletiaria anomala UBC 951]
NGAAVASPLSTLIPTLNLSSTAVPFLLQRPLTGVNNTVSPLRHFRQTADAYFTGCGDANNQFVATDMRINISAVYVHLDVADPARDPYAGQLKIVAIGAIDANTSATANGIISSVQTQTRFLTFPVETKLESICDRLYPVGPDPLHPLLGQYQSCTYGPGDVAFGVSVPMDASYALGTLSTKIRISDSSSPPLTISCIDVQVSPYYPSAWYWSLFAYLPIALVSAYFVLTAAARVATAISLRRQAFKNKARPGGAPTFVKDKLAPTVVAALAGEPAVRSPALLRFATPSCWDVLLHIQFVALLAMLSVQWPEFAYPFFRQAAWAALLGNVTLVQPDGVHALWNPLTSNAFLPASDAVGISTQIASNVSSPLFINSTTPNTFLNLRGSLNGIDAYAQMVGLDQRDVFGISTGIWLLLVAALLAASATIWAIDALWAAVLHVRARREALHSSGLEVDDTADEKYGGSGGGGTGGGCCSRGGMDHPLERLKVKASAAFGMHGAALFGNLVRLLTLFHLPLTVLSVYHFSNAADRSTSTVVLAALSFAAFSVFSPAFVLWRISKYTTTKLYSDPALLLSVGPLYNYYHPGSQLFAAVSFVHSLVLGVVVGAGQASGSAQSIIFLVLEILLAIAYVLWLPWGDGSMMAPLSFLWSVLRITTAVLVLLLAPIVNLSTQARQWLTYVILLIQAIVIVGFLLLFLAKCAEVVIRIAYKVTFDERLSHRNGGIGGALRRVRRRKYKALQHNAKKGRSRAATTHNSSTASMNNLMLAHSAQSTPLHGSTLRSSDPTAAPTSAGTASFLVDRDFGTYAAYLRADAHDEGTIMSAMPPTPLSQSQLTSSSSQPYDPAASSPPTGFVRLGGGRATDEQPYQLPPPSSAGTAYARPSPQANGPFGRLANSQQQQYLYQHHQHLPQHEVGWAPAAGTDGEAPHKKRGMRVFWRRIAMSDDSSSDEDDVAEWGAGGELRTRQWAGLAKINATLSGLRLAKGKRREQEHDQQDELSTPAEPENGERGFAVVRPTRKAGNGTLPLSPSQHLDGLPASPAPAPVDAEQPTHVSPAHIAAPRNSTNDLRRTEARQQHKAYAPAPSDSSHDSSHEDAAAKEDTFWLAPEVAAAMRAAKPPPKLRLTSDRAQTSSSSTAPSGPISAADMYATAYTNKSSGNVQGSQSSLLSRYTEAQSAEIFTHEDIN